MSIKLADIAQQANVSVSLVSRVLNEDATLRVKPATRARILKQWEKLSNDLEQQQDDTGAGPAPRRTRRLTRRMTRNIIMPMPQVFDLLTRPVSNLSAFINSQFLRHFQRRLLNDRFRLSVRYFDPGDQDELIDDLLTSRGRYWDAVILTHELLHDRLMQGLLDRQIPHLYKGPDRHRVPLHSVTFNIPNSFDPVLDHLESLGHERIGFCGATRSERYKHGLKTALARRNRLPRPRWCCLTDDSPGSNALWSAYTPQGIEAARQIALEWVAWWKQATPPARPTAVICNNDQLAFGLLDAIREHGLIPGRDLSVVGNDNIQRHGAEHLPQAQDYALTTLDNPVDVIGRRCAERLINQIVHHQHDIAHEYIPRQLIVRQTTGPARS